jgi:hypothetical protein
LIKNLFLFGCVLLALFLVFGYAAGWVTFSHSDNQETTTIQIDTGEVKEAADDAVAKGGELLEETGERIRNLGNSDDHTAPVPTSQPAAEDPAEAPDVSPTDGSEPTDKIT